MENDNVDNRTTEWQNSLKQRCLEFEAEDISHFCFRLKSDKLNLVTNYIKFQTLIIAN